MIEKYVRETEKDRLVKTRKHEILWKGFEI